MPSYTPERTWAAGEYLRIHWLNTFVRDNQTFLRSPYGVRARATLAQQIPVSVWTSVSFDATSAVEEYDTAGILDQSSNSSRFTLPAGLWLITAAATFQTSTASMSDTGIRLLWNGGSSLSLKPPLYRGQAAPATAISTVGGMLLAYLSSSGSFFELQVFQNDNIELNLTSCRLNARFLAASGTTPAWTAPRTWTDTVDTLTAALLNTHVRDDHDHLYYRRAAVVGLAANQSISSNSWTTVTLGAGANIYLNNGSIWAAGNPSRITPGLAGKWLIAGCVWFAKETTVASSRGFRFRFNGVDVSPIRLVDNGNSTHVVLTGSQEYSLSATDYVELQVYQDSTVAINIIDGVGASLGAGTWLGAVFLGG